MASFLWLDCRSALVARHRYRPARVVVSGGSGALVSPYWASCAGARPDRVSRPARGLRSVAVPAAARWAIPDLPSVPRPVR